MREKYELTGKSAPPLRYKLRKNARKGARDLGSVGIRCSVQNLFHSSEDLVVGFVTKDQELDRITKHTRVCKFFLNV